MSLAGEKQPVDWEAVKNAIHDWIAGAIDVGERVIEEEQNVAQPSYPYASYLIADGPIDASPIDELRDAYDSANDEIVSTTTNQSVIVVKARCAGGFLDGSTDELHTGFALASRLQSSLGLRSVIRKFDSAGMALVSKEGVVRTTRVINGKTLSEAVLTVRMRVATEMTERKGFIEQVQIVSPDFNVDETIDI